MVICVVGPKSSGKTLLIKRLQENNFESMQNFNSLPKTVQTNGTNLLRLIKKSDLNEDEIFIIQEIGGEMIDLSLNFIDKSTKVIYILDSSDLNKLSFNFNHLMRILTSNSIKNKKLLIVLNKTDLQSTIQIEEFAELLFLDKLEIEFIFNSIEIIKSSCLTGRGLKDIYNFITTN